MIMEFKCRLKVIFAEENISQRDFAKRVGIAESTLSLIVRGKSLPTLPVAYKIAMELGRRIEEIWIPVES